MQKSTKLGTVLLTVGAGSALSAGEAAEHGAVALAVVSALLSGACTALGATAIVIGWAGRYPEA